MSSLLRACVIGMGVMGRHHVRVLGELTGVQLVGVAEPEGPHDAPPLTCPIFRDLDELLDQRPDMCVVAAPTVDHVELGMRLAAAGIPTLLEKPLAATTTDGMRLVETFEAAGVPAGVGHIERYNPAVQALHSRLAAGELGEIYQVVTSRQGPFPDRIRDVGVVKDLATHDLDLTPWVTGSTYDTVSAHILHRSGRPHEDLVAVAATLSDGAVASHLVNWLTPTKERYIAVTGERGRFVADTLTADLTRFANASVPARWDNLAGFRGVSEGDVLRFAIDKPEPLVSELSAFRDLVRGESASVVSLHEGLAALEMAERVLEAADSDSVIRLHPIP
ncbi:MAG: Gfo/Idh/MocA family oxidoreductase [Acidimicrobiia bacterium]